MADLTPDHRRRADGMPIWVVWYEDRFGWGPDRDPASPVGAFASEAEANAYVEANGGPHDVEAGKFDGLFVQQWELLSAVERNVVSAEWAAELLNEHRPLR